MKTRPSPPGAYTEEFKDRVVQRYLSGTESSREVGATEGIKAGTLRHWALQRQASAVLRQPSKLSAKLSELGAKPVKAVANLPRRDARYPGGTAKLPNRAARFPRPGPGLVQSEPTLHWEFQTKITFNFRPLST